MITTSSNVVNDEESIENGGKFSEKSSKERTLEDIC
jgi:hypothetical protein